MSVVWKTVVVAWDGAGPFAATVGDGLARLQRAKEKRIGNRGRLLGMQLSCEEDGSIFRRKKTIEGSVERYGEDVKIRKSCVAGRERRAVARNWSEREEGKREQRVRRRGWAKTVKR